MKTKVRFCKVRSPQIKKCKKETSFKIQFYIGIHLSGIVLGCFSDLSAMSPSPIIYDYNLNWYLGHTTKWQFHTEWT